MIPKLTVYANPYAKNDLCPQVRFEALNGFSVRHGNIKGTWLPTIKEAVEDFNASVKSAVGSLRLSQAVPEAFPLASCFGIDTAWRAWQLANPPKPAPCPPPYPIEAAGRGPLTVTISGPSASGKEALRCLFEQALNRGVKDRPNFDPLRPSYLERVTFKEENAQTATQAKEAQDAADPRRNAPFSLMGLLAMAAAMGALEDVEDKGEPMFLDAMPEMAHALGKAGLLHRTGPNSAVVAIPRKMGEAFIKELEAAIRSGNLERVKALTVGRKFD